VVCASDDDDDDDDDDDSSSSSSSLLVYSATNFFQKTLSFGHGEMMANSKMVR
jgi:hypothetical protein